MAEHVARMGENNNVGRNLMGKPAEVYNLEEGEVCKITLG
jgi:hypothetical protein